MAGAVGFIGLGQIGGPMAARLVGWPEGLVVFDVRPEAADPLVEQGAVRAGSVAEVGAACAVISVMVRDDEQVRSVVAELLPAAASGTVIAVHSTIRAETAEALAEDGAGHDVAVLDVPVSGGFMGAHEGTLAAMVGGDRAAYERARDVFARWATLVVHAGGPGDATRMKLARNMMHFAAYTAALEAMALAEAAGLDLPTLGRVVRHSDGVTGGAGAIMVRDTAAPLSAEDPLREIFTHTRELADKDLTLALELAESLAVDTPMARQAKQDFPTRLGL